MLKCRSRVCEFFCNSSNFAEIQKSGFTSGKRKQIFFFSPLFTGLVVLPCQRLTKICFIQTLQLITDFKNALSFRLIICTYFSTLVFLLFSICHILWECCSNYFCFYWNSFSWIWMVLSGLNRLFISNY